MRSHLIEFRAKSTLILKDKVKLLCLLKVEKAVFLLANAADSMMITINCEFKILPANKDMNYKIRRKEMYRTIYQLD